MEKKQKISTRKIVFVALMAALTVAGSALRITLPIDIAGTTSFHLGNIMCALSGLLLGPWLGGLAAGLGSAIYDMTNPLYISECWITFLTKGAYGLAVGLVVWKAKGKWSYGKATIATMAGIIITSLYQRINLMNRAIMGTMLGLCLLVSAMAYAAQQLSRDDLNLWSNTIANVMLLGIIVAFIVAGLRKRVNVYEAFIEGAKGGFDTAVRIIPYLVAILVAIGMFRASGAMDVIIDGIGKFFTWAGINADFVPALPTALMKPLSGSGARGMMVDAMTTYGADSFVGRLSCIFQGATDTTFYILAVYFGSVGVRNTRHAVMAGLLTDLVGVLAAIVIAYIFFY